MTYDVVEVVIDKLVRRFRLRDWMYDIEDLVEDIAEALKFIGAAKVYEDKVELITFTGMAAPVPSDCLHIKYLSTPNYPYKESGSFVEADVSDGTELALYYQSMPVDARGYPLVPDVVEVREAIMWFLARNLAMGGVIRTVNYQIAEQEWQWRCSSARATLNVPSLNTWAKVANNFNRLNPLKDQHEKNYAELGKSNTLNRDRNRTH